MLESVFSKNYVRISQYSVFDGIIWTLSWVFYGEFKVFFLE